jgi:DNA-directed RNA polymerase subunit RPC12/RpoP|nr:MAG TPA: PcfJ like protein [Caudoviricetes sp.]
MKGEKELLSLPVAPAPAVMIIEPQYKEIPYWNGTYKQAYTTYGYSAEIIRDNILAVTIYNYLRQAEYRVFIGDYDYVSQKYDKEKNIWCRSTAKLETVYCMNGWGNNEFVTDEKTVQAAKQWLGCLAEETNNPIYKIAAYLNDIGKTKLKRKYDKIRKSIDDMMLQIRPLSADFEKWIENVPMKGSRYIFYHYSGRKEQDGYCTHCNTKVKVKGAKHEAAGICPHCHSKIIFLSYGKRKRGFTDSASAVYIQKGDDDLIFRRFSVVWDYEINSSGAVNCKKHIYETNRSFYLQNKHYEWGEFKNTGEYRFCVGESSWPEEYFNACSGYIYSRNLKQVFISMNPNKSYLKYIPYGTLLKNIGDVRAKEFYVACMSYPQIEYFAKLKLYHLARQLINGNYDLIRFCLENQKLKEIGITKQTLPDVQRYDLGYEEIKLYQACKKYGTGIFEELLQKRRSGKSREVQCIIKLLSYLSYEKIMEYVEEQKKSLEHPYGFDNTTRVLGDWCDYVDNCIALGWDLNDTKVLKPKDLEQRHDIAVQLVEMKENSEQREKIVQKYYEHIYDLFYESGDYAITLPRNIQDLKYEGDMLHHCVYTNYASSVAKGQSIILFVRKKDQFYRPLATAEIDPETYKLIQLRGEKNHTVSKEIQKFVDGYITKIKKLQAKQKRSAA